MAKNTEVTLTLEQEIQNLGRLSSCHHESEIRAEMVVEVLSLLRRYGVVERTKAESGKPSCDFCGAAEVTFEHKKYCIYL